MVPALVRDQIQRGPVQQEEALQLSTGEVTSEPLIRSNLVISQEIEGHSRTTYGDSRDDADPSHPAAKIILSANFGANLLQPRSWIATFG